jgi:hypothetical protein
MPCHGAFVILARMVIMPGRAYHDLVILPAPTLTFGVYDPIHSVWREQFDEGECRARLLNWPEIPTDPYHREQTSSHVTEEGRHWLQGGWHVRGDEV